MRDYLVQRRRAALTEAAAIKNLLEGRISGLAFEQELRRADKQRQDAERMIVEMPAQETSFRASLSTKADSKTS